jgi:hypothetical protein
MAEGKNLFADRSLPPDPHPPNTLCAGRLPPEQTEAPIAILRWYLLSRCGRQSELPVLFRSWSAHMESSRYGRYKIIRMCRFVCPLCG